MEELNKRKLKNTYFWLMCLPLSLHIAYEGIFLYMQETSLIYYNLISIAVFLTSMFYLLKINEKISIILCFVEVTVFCAVSTVVLGWDFGFQNWLIPSCILCLSIPFSEKREFYIISLMKTVVYTALYFVVKLEFNIENYTFINIFFCITNVISIFGMIFLAERMFKWSRAVENLMLQDEVKKMQELVGIDELTGLFTRHKMNEILENMNEYVLKKEREFYIAFADIDDFKYVNDTFGHDAGDKVLSSVAEIMSNELRNEDVIARWGGEEFLILLRNDKLFKKSLSKDKVVLILNRVRQKIQNSSIQYKDESISITVTFGGVSSLDCNDVSEMIKLADECMYEGKHSGKNKVVIK